jgi:hypothetical protein
VKVQAHKSRTVEDVVWLYEYEYLRLKRNTKAEVRENEIKKNMASDNVSLELSDIKTA